MDSKVQEFEVFLNSIGKAILEVVKDHPCDCIERSSSHLTQLTSSERVSRPLKLLEKRELENSDNFNQLLNLEMRCLRTMFREVIQDDDGFDVSEE